MRAASSALAHHIRQEVTTLATLWRVTRSDGNEYGFTDHDQDIVFDDGEVRLTYRADSGYTQTEITDRANLAVDNLEVEAFFDSDMITEADLRAGRWDFATVRVYMVNWKHPTMGAIKLGRGLIGQCTSREISFIAEYRGIGQKLQQVIGDTYMPTCRHDLFDAGCMLNAALHTDETQIATVSTDRRTFTVPASAVRKRVIDFASGAAMNQRLDAGRSSITIGVFSRVPDGTPRNPFLVATPSALHAMRDDDLAWYALATTIDMSGWGNWTPISSFRGGLDGRGYEIQNLTCSTSATKAGLFADLDTGSHVRRLTLRNATIRNGSSTIYKGALAAQMNASSLVEDCATISGVVHTDGNNAGALIGVMLDDSRIRRCIAATKITGTVGGNVGGVVGLFNTPAFTSSLVFDQTLAGTISKGNDPIGGFTAGAITTVTTAAMYATALYAGYDFVTLWEPPDGDYPSLRRWSA